jgi:C4-dicarboxylate-binding protein DctP
MNLKNLIQLICACVLITTTLSAETTIKVTLQLPITHSLSKNWLEFKNIVEKKSNGELKVLIFPSAQLYKDKQVPQAVGTGAIEAGSTFIGRFSGAVPLVDVVSLPFLFKNDKHLTKAVSKNSKMRKIIDDEILKETGAKVLWWQAYSRNIYLNNFGNVKKPSDFKGKKIRTYGIIQGWTVKSFGAFPTIMSGSKQFLAYQQGVVDAGMTGLSAVKSRKLYEVMNHLTVTNDSAIEFIAIINNKFFNSLSAKNQKIINNAALYVEKRLRQEVYTSEDKIINELKNKIHVLRLTPEERLEWEKVTKPVTTKFIKKVGPMGQKIIDIINNLK